MINTPIVIEKTIKGEYSCDIYSKFLKNRIIFLNGTISEESSNSIISQILYLDMENNEDIKIYINSNGGDVYSGLAIYDIMKYVNSEINTICFGVASSMAALLLSSGSKGKRFCYNNSRIMIHQPIGGSRGQASDMRIQTKEILYLKKKINKIFSKNTNKPFKVIKKNTNRDYFMSPFKSLNYGLIDFIILNN